ncbi:MAG: aminotransferase class I/II-fold pyridoxal phosphate-dependent enzyme [Acidobacteriaceae bacterium]|nr:aminotransferase class I/II-fold pyridoxal phosphate-dependent enzyme [Acidobacteriaceae bacterium]
MFTRRTLAKNLGVIAAGIACGGEAAYAERSRIGKQEIVLLNANENPDGPPGVSVQAMTRVLAKGGRYHDEDNDQFSEILAKAEGLKAENALLGSGSSEILHCAVDAFTSATRPLITSAPAYELPVDIATAEGHPVLKLPMTPEYAADVHALVREAEKAQGGLIYLVNPNNPTSTITRNEDVAWLIDNLPPNTVALIDEAYIHFTSAARSAIPSISKGKPVVVARTFSKIYGMAGLRVGYALSRADLISKMAVYRNNVLSLPGVFAAKAAFAEAATLIPQRRARFDKIRSQLCGWLDAHRYTFIPPHANFVMIDVKRDVRQVIPAMAERGIAVGRPFPPMDHFLRVTIGNEFDMARFEEEFVKVVHA